MTTTLNLETGIQQEREELHTCEWCNEETSEVFETNDGYEVCEECKEEHFIYCDNCVKLVHLDDSYIIYDETLCEECFNECAIVCDRCGDYEWRDYMSVNNSGDFAICRNCYENEYTYCDYCDDLIHLDNARYNEDGDAFCPGCYEPEDAINNYSYKPEPRFYGNTSDNVYIGVELEVDTPGDAYVDREEAAQDVLRVVNGELYNKHDSSLNYGFEIVSHPATLEYHLYKLGWDEVLDTLREHGLRSHDVGTCGLHVHIGREAFGDEIQRDGNIAKLLLIVERHWDKFVRFSRRTSSQLDRWAASYCDYLEKTPNEVCGEELLETAKSAGRYFAVNLENYHTVELRLFRGTLNSTTFKATLQFVKTLRDLVVTHTIDEINTMSWNEIVKFIQEQEYNELNEYLETRGLLSA